MSDTTSDRTTTHSQKTSHGESHTSMSERKSRRKSHVDLTDANPQVTKSRTPGEKVTAHLPREVTFSALSLRRAERDTERGGDQQNSPAEDLTEAQKTALERLARPRPSVGERKPR